MLGRGVCTCDRVHLCACVHMWGGGVWTHIRMCVHACVCACTCAHLLGSLIPKEGEAGTAWEQAHASPDVLSAPSAACAKSVRLLPL